MRPFVWLLTLSVVSSDEFAGIKRETNLVKITLDENVNDFNKSNTYLHSHLVEVKG